MSKLVMTATTVVAVEVQREAEVLVVQEILAQAGHAADDGTDWERGRVMKCAMFRTDSLEQRMAKLTGDVSIRVESLLVTQSAWAVERANTIIAATVGIVYPRYSSLVTVQVLNYVIVLASSFE